jgi:ElaB/YqjD/DUF883 family membrane-anchored ribosome-binding protein
MDDIAHLGVSARDAVVAHHLLTDLAVVHGAVSSLLTEWDHLTDDDREVLRRSARRRAAQARARLRRMTPAALASVSTELHLLLAVAERTVSAGRRISADDRAELVGLLTGAAPSVLAAAVAGVVRGAPCAAPDGSLLSVRR